MTTPTVPKLDRSALLGILAQQSDDVLADLMGRMAQAAIDAQFDEFIVAGNTSAPLSEKTAATAFAVGPSHANGQHGPQGSR